MGKNQFFFTSKFSRFSEQHHGTFSCLQFKPNSTALTMYMSKLPIYSFLNFYFHTKGGTCPLRKKIHVGDIADMGDIADIAIVLALLTIKYTKIPVL